LLSDNQLDQVRKFAEEVAVREGCRLYDVEFHDGGHRALRIYIDKAEGAVSIDDCANVSRGLNLRLDVEDVIPGGRYDLEVSSPGMDRKLTQLWHFQTAVGQTIRLQFSEAGSGALKPYEGKLAAIEGAKLKFENAMGPFEIEFSNVKKARIHLGDVLGRQPPPGKKRGR
jgi:ribosome maturation factor RimP